MLQKNERVYTAISDTNRLCYNGKYFWCGAVDAISELNPLILNEIANLWIKIKLGK